MGDDNEKETKVGARIHSDNGPDDRPVRRCKEGTGIAVFTDEYACGCIGISLVAATSQEVDGFELVDFAMVGICGGGKAARLALDRRWRPVSRDASFAASFNRCPASRVDLADVDGDVACSGPTRDDLAKPTGKCPGCGNTVWECQCEPDSKRQTLTR